MPIKEKKEKWDGRSENGLYINKNGYKFDVLKQKVVTNVEQMPEYFLGNTAKEAQEVYDSYNKLLNNLAYTFSIFTGIDRFDLFGEALIGLARAKRDWNSKRSDNFKTYATYIIRDTLYEYIRNNTSDISIPSYIKKANNNLKIIKNICDKYSINYIHVLEEENIDNIFNKKDLIKINEAILNIKNAANRSNVEYKKFIQRVAYMPENIEYINQQVKETYKRNKQKLDAAILVKQLKQFMTNDELIICEGIMNDKSFDVIGKEFNKSKSWVSIKVKKLKLKLLKKINEVNNTK